MPSPLLLLNTDENLLFSIKIDKRKGSVFYKRVKGTVFVAPYQVFLPSVVVLEKLHIDAAQYMDLISMI